MKLIAGYEAASDKTAQDIWKEAADAILKALSTTIMRKRVTIDFYNLMNDATLLKTSEFAQEIIKNL